MPDVNINAIDAWIFLLQNHFLIRQQTDLLRLEATHNIAKIIEKAGKRYVYFQNSIQNYLSDLLSDVLRNCNCFSIGKQWNL